ncbi:MAG: T9SS type A sorting domain-containing protein [Bacteroidota bacterium]
MKINYSKNRIQQKALPFILALFAFSGLTTQAQFRSYAKVYSDNIKGGATIFGNTLTHIVNSNGNADTAKMNNNRANGNSTYGNDNSNIRFIDVDGNSGNGTGTRNSSTADLSLPAGTNTIKLARLYWGARVRKGDFDITLDTFQRIKVRYGTSGAYTEYRAAHLDKNTTGTGNSAVSQYQAYVDITSFIQSNGTGTYSVGNVAASVGSVSSGGNYAGWTIVVVYENLDIPYNSVRVYDGFQQVFASGSALISSVTLTGLNVPSGALTGTDAKMGAMVWEGDANLKQDFLKINGTNFYNGLNAIDNPWNGTITDNGVHITAKSPNYTNQMGMDIDQFHVGEGYGIQPGDTTVHLEFGTEADQYFPGLFTFVIKTKDPTIIIDKYVVDASRNNVIEAGEALTYKLKGKNMGVGNANYCTVTDSLPAGITYVPGTLKVVYSSGFTPDSYLTDAEGDDQAEIVGNKTIIFRVGTGANAYSGGILAPNEEFELEFQVTVDAADEHGNLPPIINVARITGVSDAFEKFTDDGTAIIEPLAGPLPVTLKSFTALLLRNNLIKLDWATLQEINCDRYEIERSYDGKNFTKAGTVKGHGFTSLDMYYTFNDDVTGVPANIIYYRLRQIDIDGKSSFSKVVSVRLKKTTGFSVSPNPFNSYVNINIDWNTNETTVIKVFTMSGTEVLSKNIKMNKGTNYIQLNELSALTSGNYIIQFNGSEGKTFKQVSKL